MSIRRVVSIVVLFFAMFAANINAQPAPDQNQFPRSYVPSGAHLYKQYCAACHGPDGKGFGPARLALKLPAADLTTLADRHGGKFPYEYVTGVLRFGPGVPAHGSIDMPTWGPIFDYLDNHNQGAVQERIMNLCEYLASLQAK